MFISGNLTPSYNKNIPIRYKIIVPPDQTVLYVYDRSSRLHNSQKFVDNLQKFLLSRHLEFALN